MAAEKDIEVDMAFMDLYSRQIGAFGLEAMLKLTKMKVLVVGLRGLGVEVAKNTTLAGVHTMSLFDPEPTAVRDLGTNFFLTEADIGTSRAVVCAPKIQVRSPVLRQSFFMQCHYWCFQELNPNVNVKAVVEKELTEDLVGAHNFVVFTTGSRVP